MTKNHDRKSWKESWRLFNQAIYIYLISCWIESNFQIELSSQASQLDSSSWVQLLNSTRHFFKRISIQFNTFRVEYLTRTQVLNLTRSVYVCLKALLVNKFLLFLSMLQRDLRMSLLHETSTQINNFVNKLSISQTRSSRCWLS